MTPATQHDIWIEWKLTADDYARAERFLPWNSDKYVMNGNIQHHWIRKEDRFWYMRTTPRNEREFVVVDAATGEISPAFDQKKVAAGLSKATNVNVDPGALPFAAFRYIRNGNAIQFLVSNTLWTCDLQTGECSDAFHFEKQPGEVLSPDGAYAVFLKDHNLWIRPTNGEPEFALTTDGSEHYDYARSPGDSTHFVSDIRRAKPMPPQVIWSPDSRFILTHMIDERKVEDMFLIQSVPEGGTLRPKLYPYRYAFVGDENVAQLEPVVFYVAARRKVPFATAPLVAFHQPLVVAGTTWWSADSTKVYYLNIDRFSKSMSLFSADPLSGNVTEIFNETSKTFLLPGDSNSGSNPSIRVLTNGDVIWYSERDGWGHLYYYDGTTGELRNQITQGNWLVRDIVRVEEASNKIYFVASGREEGRDPYYQHLYSCNLDGSGILLLTPEDAEHQFSTPKTPIAITNAFPDLLSTREEKGSFSRSGRYFVYTYSRVDKPPVMVLRTAEGQLVRELETADASPLAKSGGYTPVESFQTVAADGVTAIYGNIYRPSTLDPGKKYPVVDAIYSGPQKIRAPKNFMKATFERDGAQAIAELGFIVVTIDGRGTPHRSKAFLDDVYGDLGKAGNLEDHITGIRQMAQCYPYMDIDRVGIFGTSAGGFASTHAIFAYPDFYKVAVSSEGNHNQLCHYYHWAERYNGPTSSGNYADSANENFAANFKGKLLLMHGDLDDNVLPSQTMRIVDALIKANKDFDLLIIPNGNHTIFLSPYFIRRQWDYFVRNLLYAEPPSGYQITRPQWYADLMGS